MYPWYNVGHYAYSRLLPMKICTHTVLRLCFPKSIYPGINIVFRLSLKYLDSAQHTIL